MTSVTEHEEIGGAEHRVADQAQPPNFPALAYVHRGDAREDQDRHDCLGRLRTNQSVVVTEATVMGGWWIWTPMKMAPATAAQTAAARVRLGGGGGHCWAPWSWVWIRVFPALSSNGTKGSGEPTSPGDVIEVVISHRTWSGGSSAPASPAQALLGPRRQAQFLGPAKGRPTVVHAELHVDVLRVGPQGVEGHHEFASDVGAAQVGPKEPKHVQFPLAERVDETLCLRSTERRPLPARQKLFDVTSGDATPGCFSEQRRHGLAFIDEQPDVALGLCCRQRLLERSKGRRAIASVCGGERLEDQDLDDAARPGSRFRRPPGDDRGGPRPAARDSSAPVLVFATARSSLARVMCSNSPR